MSFLVLTLTTAGIAAIATGNAAGPKLDIVACKLGDAYGYTPVAGDTDIHGSATLISTIHNYYIVDDNTVGYVIQADVNTSFNFGELGLYDSAGTLIALTAFASLQTKVAGIEVELQPHLIYAGAGTAVGFTIPTVADAKVLELLDITHLSRPSLMNANYYLTHSYNELGTTPIVASRRTDAEWDFQSHPILMGTGTISAGTDTVTMVSVDTVGLVENVPDSGKYLLQMTSGVQTGTARIITAYDGTSHFTLSGALGGVPANGDTFKIYRSLSSAINSRQAVAVTAPYTITEKDRGKVLVVNNAGTVTLPTATSKDKYYNVTVFNNSAGTVTVSRASTDTIAGAGVSSQNTIDLSAHGGAADLVIYNTTSWLALLYQQSASVSSSTINTGTQGVVFYANGDFVVPTGINQLWALVVGGGGSGGIGGNNTKGGAGGGGGYMGLAQILVQPGETLHVTVGTGGNATGVGGGATAYGGGAVILANHSKVVRGSTTIAIGLAGGNGQGAFEAGAHAIGGLLRGTTGLTGAGPPPQLGVGGKGGGSNVYWGTLPQVTGGIYQPGVNGSNGSIGVPGTGQGGSGGGGCDGGFTPGNGGVGGSGIVVLFWDGNLAGYNYLSGLHPTGTPWMPRDPDNPGPNDQTVQFGGFAGSMGGGTTGTISPPPNAAAQGLILLITGTWTVPAALNGVAIRIAAIGPGGNGAAGTAATYGSHFDGIGGGGGGAGEVGVATVTVATGDVLTVTIPTASGSHTTVVRSAVTLVTGHSGGNASGQRGGADGSGTIQPPVPSPTTYPFFNLGGAGGVIAGIDGWQNAVIAQTFGSGNAGATSANETVAGRGGTGGSGSTSTILSGGSGALGGPGAVIISWTSVSITGFGQVPLLGMGNVIISGNGSGYQ